jgi:acetyltransferase-like isoleucine patch superfamily enzyme
MKKYLKLLILKIFNILFENIVFKLIEDFKINRYKINLKNVGSNFRIGFPTRAIGLKYVSIGDNFQALYNLRIEAWDKHNNNTYSPYISIGNNVSINSDVHIGAINSVIIGNNVLLASRIYISDHSHGNTDLESLKLKPSHRKLYSKGPVIVEDNVWIGEGVCIMPGVTIGKNSIIGANSVVTKSFPPFSIIAGIPAKLLKTSIK